MNEIKWKQTILTKIKKLNQATQLLTDLKVSQNDIQTRMDYYYSIPQPPQKSQEWLNQRTNYITASALEDALSPKWSSKRNELLKNKVSGGQYRTFFGNEATRWGEKYEDVANAVYCYRQKTEVAEFGLLPHTDQELYFLGASTDGISGKLINLEIKCPFSRTIIPGRVPKHYWKQTQLQMEVLDLPMTHFLECKFREYATGEDFWEDFDYPCENPEKGIIIEYVDMEIMNNDGDPKTVYLYSPVGLTEQDLRLWEKETIHQMVVGKVEGGKGVTQNSSSTQIYIRSHYWVLDVCSCVNIARDKAWFQAQIPYLKEFWREVEDYRSLFPDDPNMAFHQLCEDIQKHKGNGLVGKQTIMAIDPIEAEEGRPIPNPCLIDSTDEEGDILENHQSLDQYKQAKNCLIISTDEESGVSESESEVGESDSESESGVSESDSESESESENNRKLEKEVLKQEFPLKATYEEVQQFLNPDGTSSSEGELLLTPKTNQKTGIRKQKSVQPKPKLTVSLKPRLTVSEPPLMLDLSNSQESCESAPGKLGTQLQVTPKTRSQQIQKPVVQSLVLSSDEDSDLESDSFDLDEGYSSGSDTENDSPPMRPPPKEMTYYRRKGTRFRGSSNSSPKGKLK